MKRPTVEQQLALNKIETTGAQDGQTLGFRPLEFHGVM
jgi:hypothetical protein